MADRLSSLDTSFLHLEDEVTPLNVGSVMIFDPPAAGLDFDQVVQHIANRMAFVPRYRQRIRSVPGGLANPVWVDDERFDISYHVRRSALPRPGSDEQLEELVARIMPRQLDAERPLWEVYVVEGLTGGRFAVISKVHQALVDGVRAVDIGHVILDSTPHAQHDLPDTWRPVREPSPGELLVGALSDAVRTPGQVIETVQTAITDLRGAAQRVFSAAGGVLSTVARLSARPAPSSPLNAQVGRARRFVMIGTDLEAYRKVRTRLARGTFASEVTVHDVVLAAITGAMRNWLLTRGESIRTDSTVRAMVPVSIADEDDPDAGLARQLTACFIDLPVGEPNPAMRLHQVAFAMRQQVEGGRAVGAQTLVGLGGFAPPTIHAMGARLASAVSRRLYNVAITNVPGPQKPLYAAGAHLVATYPVMPLMPGQALSIGLTSYDGGVYYGLYTDRDSVPDADVLGQAVAESLKELLEAPRQRRRA